MMMGGLSVWGLRWMSGARRLTIMPIQIGSTFLGRGAILAMQGIIN